MIKLKSLLIELEYPLAKGDDLQSYGGMAGWKGKLVWMSPDKFLRLCYPLPDTERNDTSSQNLRNRMLKGLPIDFLVLKIDSKRKKVMGHEGRHKATVAKELGIEKVPVLVYFEEVYPRVPKWGPEHHEFADKAEFHPEWDKLHEAEMEAPVILGAITPDLEIKAFKGNDDSRHPAEWYRFMRWRYMPEIQMLTWWEVPDDKEVESVKSYLHHQGYKVQRNWTFGSIREGASIYDFIKKRMEELRLEWERLDSMGSERSKQIEIERELDYLKDLLPKEPSI